MSIKAFANSLMKIIFYLILNFLITLQLLAQVKPKVNPTAKSIAPCNLTLNQAPKLRGFYLGQSKKELEKIPHFTDEYRKNNANDPMDKSKFGFVMLNSVNLFYQQPGIRKVSDKNYDDIEFYLHFLDDKIMYISVQYTEYEPTNLNEFIKQVSQTTGLPLDSWKIKDKYNAEMICTDFDVSLWTGNVVGRPEYQDYPSLAIADKSAENELELREKKYNNLLLEAERERHRIEAEKKLEEERKRKIFKP